MRDRTIAFACIFFALVLVPAYVTASDEPSKAWVGDSLEFELFLRSAPIVSRKDLGEGRNQPSKITLEKDGRTLHGIWKPIERGRHEWAWECYQAEVVAYELDKLIGLKMVPPTVERSIGGQEGSLQLWVEGDVSTKRSWERARRRMIGNASSHACRYSTTSSAIAR
jgi:hypothetical protein